MLKQQAFTKRKIFEWILHHRHKYHSELSIKTSTCLCKPEKGKTEQDTVFYYTIVPLAIRNLSKMLEVKFLDRQKANLLKRVN